MVTTNYPYIIPEGVVWSARTGRLMTVAEAATELEAQAGGGGGGGAVDPLVPPGQPGELIFNSYAASAGFDNTNSYAPVTSLALPAGSWSVFGLVGGNGMGGLEFRLGLHLSTNLGDSLAQALASGSGNNSQIRTGAVVLNGGQTVTMKAETDAVYSLPAFTVMAQRLA